MCTTFAFPYMFRWSADCTSYPTSSHDRALPVLEEMHSASVLVGYWTSWMCLFQEGKSLALGKDAAVAANVKKQKRLLWSSLLSFSLSSPSPPAPPVPSSTYGPCANMGWHAPASTVGGCLCSFGGWWWLLLSPPWWLWLPLVPFVELVARVPFAGGDVGCPCTLGGRGLR